MKQSEIAGSQVDPAHYLEADGEEVGEAGEAKPSIYEAIMAADLDERAFAADVELEEEMTLLINNKEIQDAEDAAAKEEEAKQSAEQQQIAEQAPKVTLKDFQILRVLGKGAFGKVFLVEKKDTKQYYAMKVMRKDVIIDCEKIEATILEKNVMQEVDHPFLVGLEFCFQTEGKVYLVMQFYRGGELFTHLQAARRFTEARAKRYALQIALSLAHLHKREILYRDLKPENLLLGEDGYIYLTDFGLAKKVEEDEVAKSSCGTPEYMAPEMVTEAGHSFPVDWWALGIITYEMLVSFAPFYTGETNGANKKMKDMILNKAVFFPNAKQHGFELSEPAKDFISKLLAKKPEERLGSKKGASEILEHPWLADIDQDKLLSKEIEIDESEKPRLSDDPLKLEYFSNEFLASQPTRDSLVNLKQRKKIKEHKHLFDDFDR